MKYKIDQSLYDVVFDDNGSGELSEWHIKSIRGGYVYAICFIKGVTWIKLSRKNFDWGWNSYIPRCWRQECKIGEKFRDLHTTKLQAWQNADISLIESDDLKTINKAQMTRQRQISRLKSKGR